MIKIVRATIGYRHCGGGFNGNAIANNTFSVLQPGPYLRTDKIDICPGPTWPRGPPVTKDVIYYFVEIEMYFYFFFLRHDNKANDIIKYKKRYIIIDNEL